MELMDFTKQIQHNPQLFEKYAKAKGDTSRKHGSKLV